MRKPSFNDIHLTREPRFKISFAWDSKLVFESMPYEPALILGSIPRYRVISRIIWSVTVSERGSEFIR